MISLYTTTDEDIRLAGETIPAGEQCCVGPRMLLFCSREYRRSVGRAVTEIPANCYARIDSNRGRVVLLPEGAVHRAAVRALVTACQTAREWADPLPAPIFDALEALERLEGTSNV